MTSLPMISLAVLNLLLTFLLVRASTSQDHLLKLWQLPVLSNDFEARISNAGNIAKAKINITNSRSSKIPRNLWIAFREVPPYSLLPKHTKELLANAEAEHWAVNLVDGDHAEDTFMDTFFSNTSIHWAYNIMGPASAVSKVDIWRYCALYAFGGLYIDDDSFLKAPLSTVFKDNDEMVMATENNEYNYHCWDPNFYLSNDFLHAKYKASNLTSYFYNCNLVNWAMFVAPRNPIVLELLKNVVEVVKREYFYESVVVIRRHIKNPGRGRKNHDNNFKRIICITGPAMVTATIRKMRFEYDLRSNESVIDPSGNFPFRLSPHDDFKEFGGTWKVNLDEPYAQKKKYRHYADVFEELNPSFLKHYYNTTVEETHHIDYDNHNKTWSLKVLFGAR